VDYNHDSLESSMDLIRAVAEFVVLGPAAAGVAATQLANATHARMVGTRTPISLTDGNGADMSEPFGKHPKAAMTVDANGCFSIIIRRNDVPNIASNNRLTDTAEEGQAIIKSSIACFGMLSFTVGAEVTAHTEACTFANPDGKSRQGGVTFRGDEMAYANFSSSFGAAVAKAV
jgi:hypothetical protein